MVFCRTVAESAEVNDEDDLNKIKNLPKSLQGRDYLNATPLHWRGRERSQLNTNGDRANGTFDYYGVQFSNNVYQWYFVGQSQRVQK